MTLQRLILTCKPDEIILHALYKTQDGPGPNTKARASAVTELARAGLTQAVEALEGGAEVVGASGFSTREDVLFASTSSSEAKLVRKPR